MIWPPLTARNVATLTVSQASEADRRGSAWGSELSGTVHMELETGSRRTSITVAAGTSIVCPLLAAVSARRPRGRAGRDDVLEFGQGHLAGRVIGLADGEHPPGRRGAQREEEQNAGSAEVCVYVARV